MIFNGRKPSEIAPTEIKQILGHREDIELDFKSVAYSQTGKPDNDWKLEMLKDISSFANTNGGYLFIGVEEKEEKRAKRFINIKEASNEAQKMFNICSTFIHERLIEDELVIEPYPIDADTQIIIARVLPGQRKPYMVTYNDGTVFYLRCDNGREGYNRPMTSIEIKDAILGDKVLLNLHDIHKKIESIDNKIERIEQIIVKNIMTAEGPVDKLKPIAQKEVQDDH